MAEYITGTPKERAALGEQLAWLQRRPHAALVGSLGRQALYETFDWQKAEPLTLRKSRNELRDLDVLRMKGLGTSIPARNNLPELDNAIEDSFVIKDGRPALYIPNPHARGTLRFPFHPEVLKLRMRHIGGMPVRTFSIGMQQRIEHIMAEAAPTEDPRLLAKYKKSREQFDAFVKDMRRKHPDEFPDEKYFRSVEDYYRSRAEARAMRRSREGKKQ